VACRLFQTSIQPPIDRLASEPGLKRAGSYKEIKRRKLKQRRDNKKFTCGKLSAWLSKILFLCLQTVAASGSSPAASGMGTFLGVSIIFNYIDTLFWDRAIKSNRQYPGTFFLVNSL
jgi:hypothetical protein